VNAIPLPVFFLAVFGIAWIISDSKISLPVRVAIAKRLGTESALVTFLECPACLSFWIGLGVGFGAFGSFGFAALLFAPACSAVSLLLWTWMNRS